MPIMRFYKPADTQPCYYCERIEATEQEKGYPIRDGIYTYEKYVFRCAWHARFQCYRCEKQHHFSRDHDWIEDYCKLCERCLKECPAQAIYPESVVRFDNVPGIDVMRTCIDRNKWFPFFAGTLGCSICVKVCPFSRAGDTYEKLHEVVRKRS